MGTSAPDPATVPGDHQPTIIAPKGHPPTLDHRRTQQQQQQQQGPGPAAPAPGIPPYYQPMYLGPNGEHFPLGYHPHGPHPPLPMGHPQHPSHQHLQLPHPHLHPSQHPPRQHPQHPYAFHPLQHPHPQHQHAPPSYARGPFPPIHGPTSAPLPFISSTIKSVPSQAPSPLEGISTPDMQRIESSPVVPSLHDFDLNKTHPSRTGQSEAQGQGQDPNQAQAHLHHQDSPPIATETVVQQDQGGSTLQPSQFPHTPPPPVPRPPFPPHSRQHPQGSSSFQHPPHSHHRPSFPQGPYNPPRQSHAHPKSAAPQGQGHGPGGLGPMPLSPVPGPLPGHQAFGPPPTFYGPNIPPPHSSPNSRRHYPAQSPPLLGLTGPARTQLYQPSGPFKQPFANPGYAQEYQNNGFYPPGENWRPMPSQSLQKKPKELDKAMWVGNVLNDTTVAELEAIFEAEPTEAEGNIQHDIPESIFILSKSNCAFVNYSSHEAVSRAVQRFHDKEFKNTRLVCRPRKDPAADPYSGKASSQQRYLHHPHHSPPAFVEESMGHYPGPHTLYPIHPTEHFEPPHPSSAEAHARMEKMRLDSSPRIDGASSGGESPRAFGQLKPKERAGVRKSRSPTTHGPAESRYFILKGLNEEDIKLSVQYGQWATQDHLVPILNEAFESSKNVYLVFSANKSGEFFGYARMMGAICKESEEALVAARIETNWLPSIEIPISPELKAAMLEEMEHAKLEGRQITYDEAEALARASTTTKSWGTRFPVQWIIVHKVPFSRTTHLVNPLYENREVKVSKDGTEVDPAVGEQLLSLFKKSGRQRGRDSVVSSSTSRSNSEAGDSRRSSIAGDSLAPPTQHGANARRSSVQGQAHRQGPGGNFGHIAPSTSPSPNAPHQRLYPRQGNYHSNDHGQSGRKGGSGQGARYNVHYPSYPSGPGGHPHHGPGGSQGGRRHERSPAPLQHHAGGSRHGPSFTPSQPGYGPPTNHLAHPLPPHHHEVPAAGYSMMPPYMAYPYVPVPYMHPGSAMAWYPGYDGMAYGYMPSEEAYRQQMYAYGYVPDESLSGSGHYTNPNEATEGGEDYHAEEPGHDDTQDVFGEGDQDRHEQEHQDSEEPSDVGSSDLTESKSGRIGRRVRSMTDSSGSNVLAGFSLNSEVSSVESDVSGGGSQSRGSHPQGPRASRSFSSSTLSSSSTLVPSYRNSTDAGKSTVVGAEKESSIDVDEGAIAL